MVDIYYCYECESHTRIAGLPLPTCRRCGSPFVEKIDSIDTMSYQYSPDMRFFDDLSDQDTDLDSDLLDEVFHDYGIQVGSDLRPRDILSGHMHQTTRLAVEYTFSDGVSDIDDDGEHSMEDQLMYDMNDCESYADDEENGSWYSEPDEADLEEEEMPLDDQEEEEEEEEEEEGMEEEMDSPMEDYGDSFNRDGSVLFFSRPVTQRLSTMPGLDALHTSDTRFDAEASSLSSDHDIVMLSDDEQLSVIDDILWTSVANGTQQRRQRIRFPLHSHHRHQEQLQSGQQSYHQQSRQSWLEISMDAVFQRQLQRSFEDESSNPRATPATPHAIAGLKRRRLRRGNSDTLVECSICQEQFGLQLDLISMPCGHEYHDECILQWLKISGTCPVCRCPADRRHPPQQHTPTSTSQECRVRTTRSR